MFVPDAYYHLFSRGSNRQAISIQDEDRSDFLLCLGDALSRHGLACIAYCLMPNHYHLVLNVGEAQISRAIQRLNGRYARRFNRRYGRDAHVFKNRFGAVLLETESHFRWVCGYVVTNPVRAGLCSLPDEWRWSSYRACVGLDPPPPFLDAARALAFFGDLGPDPVAGYRRFVSGCV